MMRNFFIFSFLLWSVAAAAQSPRYFYQGDGQLAVQGGEKNLEGLSPRLVALLDYLQDQLTRGKGEITVHSGYRSPEYNERLRRQGKLAGQASLHMEGMAADVVLSGADPKKLWEFVRSLDCCGAGYYAGRMVHVDTGPKRWWDQKTSKVFTDISAHNKQVYLTTEYDIYRPGEELKFRFVRMTEFPFGIRPDLGIGKLKTKEKCLLIQNRKAARDFSLSLPKGLPKDKPLQIRAEFCSKPHEQMPDFVLSNPFEIR
ncbi:MAG: YcbK family protein [Deltaproteobacteria bacterium]|nr:YcbK family protein [Deltaproteobacteria bacterium]MBI4223599.1 YcbK family protein [Deltaproteobacteria bacterium]